MGFLPPPVVDLPVSRLNKVTIIPSEDTPSFLNPTDKKIKSTACSLFVASGALISPVLASAMVFQALTKWEKLLCQVLACEQVSPDYVDLAD